MYEAAVRPVLFRLGGGDAETAHEWTLRRLAALAGRPDLLRAVGRLLAAPAAPREVFGLRFPNPVGLAAGMDKDGLALAAWPALGFGFVEAGTVTWEAQAGNERPRMFRLRDSGAVVNRMGFNNRGARALADRLARLGPGAVPLGISLGKSRVTALADAVGDYVASLRVLRPYADYFAVNVSSPNTPGLRSLQDRGHLTELLAALRAETTTPILVKIAPDLTDAAIADLLAVCTEQGVAGVIATNTTLARDGLAPRDVLIAAQAGGLSGAPLAERARAVVAFVHRESRGTLPIIGVGGVLHPDDAVRLMDAGASLVQLYTGLVYRGPALVRGCVRALTGEIAEKTAPSHR
jgi:dihydroorotate dehydrogenase